MEDPDLIASQIYLCEQQINFFKRQICEFHCCPVESDDGEIISYADYLNLIE